MKERDEIYDNNESLREWKLLISRSLLLNVCIRFNEYIALEGENGLIKEEEEEKVIQVKIQVSMDGMCIKIIRARKGDFLTTGKE